MDELRTLLENRLKDMGRHDNIHTTRFKLQIMKRFPELEESIVKKKVFLTKNAKNIENDDDIDRRLLDVACIVREHLFDTPASINDNDQESFDKADRNDIFRLQSRS